MGGFGTRVGGTTRGESGDSAGGVSKHGARTKSDGRSRSTTSSRDVAAALAEWIYSTSPTPRAALARYLSGAFPNASVRRGARREDADVVVDGVAVVLVDDLGRRFRTTFQVLAEHHDELVCYAPSCHERRPTEWRAFARRNRTAGIRFVTRDAPTPVEEPRLSVAQTIALVGVAMVAIAGLLTASLGAFVPGSPTLSTGRWIVVAALSVAAVALALLLSGSERRRVALSVLSKLAQ